MDFLEVEFEGDGESQRVSLWGEGTRFPNMIHLLRQLGFVQRESENRCHILSTLLALYCNNSRVYVQVQKQHVRDARLQIFSHTCGPSLPLSRK